MNLFRIVLTFLFLHAIHLCAHGQMVNGTWKGALYPKNTDPLKGQFYSFEMSRELKNIEIRSEQLNNGNICNKKASISLAKDFSVTINETIVAQKSRQNKLAWCKYKIDLTYDTLSGYWKGTYTSTDCANQSGIAVFYRSDETWNKDVNLPSSSVSFERMISDLKTDLPSPDKREMDRKNFQFQAVYFDFDKDELKPEYTDYLVRMGRMVKGHSDIRIKITGHTDAKGSDAYNDGLSARRAKAIETFFNQQGVPTHRLIFDFKGERAPIATNETDQGRQLNRRVDFEFIYN